MLAGSASRILDRLDDDAVVLDIGAGASPFPRADWVLDLMRYDERGLYGYEHRPDERFTADTWIQRDMCDREPFPFADKSVDFVVCSHTLEDIRDPIWVCSEINRIAKAGYIETPSRLEEQAFGIQGPWVGWGHHRWLVEVVDGGLEFTFKHHVVCGREVNQFPRWFWEQLSPEERVVAFDWHGSFTFRERIVEGPEELDGWLRDIVDRELPRRQPPPARRRLRGRRREG